MFALGDLVLGNAFGPYYFVFVIAYCYALGHVILGQDWLRRRLGALVVIAYACNVLDGVFAPGFFDGEARAWFFYSYRSPLTYSVYYLLGMSCRGLDLEGALRRHGRLLALAAGQLFVLLAAFVVGARAGAWERNAALVALQPVFVVTVTLFLLRFHWRTRAAAWLSQSSYTIYLTHLFPLYVMQRAFPPGTVGPWFCVAMFAVGLVFPVALHFGARAILGPRAALIVG